MTVKSKTEDLENFIAVADTGGFSAAANRLDIQVARVSRSVARLEAELGAPLLNRTTRRVELTAEGSVFLGYAKQALSTLEQGEDKLKSLKGMPAGRLRVDAASPFLYHQIIPLIKEFNARYPRITLELISNENIIDLIEQRTDIAIRIGRLPDSNLHAKTLGTSKLYLVASREYLAACPAPQSLSELTDHKILGFADMPQLNSWPLTEPVELVPNLSASSGEAIRQLCLDGNGIALLSNFMVRQDIDAGRLIEILPGSVVSPNARELVQAVYYRNTALSSRISAFLDFISNRLSL